MDSIFLKNYFNQLTNLLIDSSKVINQLIEIKEILIKSNSSGNKAIIVGNGGSAAISSHVSVDLSKNAGIRCINFNESNLITCFSNDFGYEFWLEKAIEIYGDKGDVLIAISSSGQSRNIITCCKAARKSKFSKIITLSGMNPENPLRKLGDINLWLNSKAYNHIENIHQFWLLAIVDLIIGQAEYSANPNAN